MARDLVGRDMLRAAGDGYAVPDAMERRAVRVVCGAAATRDAADARHLLDVLGLLGAVGA